MHLGLLNCGIGIFQALIILLFEIGYLCQAYLSKQILLCDGRVYFVRGSVPSHFAAPIILFELCADG